MTTTPTIWKPETLVNTLTTGPQGSPDIIGLADGSILTLWNDDSIGSPLADIRSQRFDINGQYDGLAVEVNTASTSDNERLGDAVALADGGYVVAYVDDQGAAADTIRLERFDAGGTSIFSTFVAAGGTLSNPEVEIAANGNYILSFTRDNAGDENARALIFNGATNVAGAEFNLAPNGVDDFRDADVAGLSNNNFVAVYGVKPAAAGQHLEFRIVNSSGAQAVAATIFASGGFDPNVAALTGGGFAVTWTQTVGASSGVFSRVISNTGVMGATITVADTANFENSSRVVGLMDGGFFIVWFDSTANQLIGQRFDNAGAVVGSNIIINSGSGPNPDVGLTADGRILVTYFDADIKQVILDPRDNTINGANASETTTTQIGDTVVFANGGNDTIFGQAGNDTINGGGGTDTIFGGGGNDTIKVLNGEFIDNVDGGIGNDTLDLSGNTTRFATIDMVAGTWDMSAASGGARAVANIEIVKGTQFGDTMTGTTGSQTFEGEDGNDILKGGADGDVLNGGNGTADMLLYSGSTGGVTVNLATNSATGGHATGDSISNFEGVIGGDGGDKLTGSSGDNILNGAIGNDILRGENGNDILDGGDGADSMTGGIGDDTYMLNSNSDSTVELVGEGSDKVIAPVTHALRVNVENLELSGNGNLNGTGNALANSITGNAGNNILNGLGGADTLRGLTGNDQYRVDDLLDLTIENNNDGIDITFASIDWVLQDNIEKLYLEGTATSGTGNALSNFMYGSSGQNTLDGAGGADRMSGLNGNDIYIVDSAGDLVFEQAGQGIDEVQSSVNHTISVNVENLTLSGAGNIKATGNTVANLISGNTGNNFIDGRQGNDTLTGGLGFDNFVFTTALTGNQDTITDFTVADDTLRLDDAVFTGIAPGFLSAAAFKLGTAATEADDRIVYNSATGEVFYDADGLGGAGQVRFAFVTAGTALTQGDFFVF